MKSETCPRCGQRVGLDSLDRYVKHRAPDSAPYPCSTSGRLARDWTITRKTVMAFAVFLAILGATAEVAAPETGSLMVPHMEDHIPTFEKES